jgi:hypothetical protein
MDHDFLNGVVRDLIAARPTEFVEPHELARRRGVSSAWVESQSLDDAIRSLGLSSNRTLAVQTACTDAVESLSDLALFTKQELVSLFKNVATANAVASALMKKEGLYAAEDEEEEEEEEEE